MLVISGGNQSDNVDKIWTSQAEMNIKTHAELSEIGGR